MKTLDETLEQAYQLIEDMMDFIPDERLLEITEGKPLNTRIIETLNHIEDEIAIAQNLTTRKKLTKFNKEKGWR